MTGSDVTGCGVSQVIGNEVCHMTKSEVSNVTGSVITGGDIIFPRFFLTLVVVQNVTLHEKLEDTKGIIISRKSNDKQHNDQKIPKK